MLKIKLCNTPQKDGLQYRFLRGDPRGNHTHLITCSTTHSQLGGIIAETIVKFLSRLILLFPLLRNLSL